MSKKAFSLKKAETMVASGVRFGKQHEANVRRLVAAAKAVGCTCSLREGRPGICDHSAPCRELMEAAKALSND